VHLVQVFCSFLAEALIWVRSLPSTALMRSFEASCIFLENRCQLLDAAGNLFCLGPIGMWVVMAATAAVISPCASGLPPCPDRPAGPLAELEDLRLDAVGPWPRGVSPTPMPLTPGRFFAQPEDGTSLNQVIRWEISWQPSAPPGQFGPVRLADLIR